MRSAPSVPSPSTRGSRSHATSCTSVTLITGTLRIAPLKTPISADCGLFAGARPHALDFADSPGLGSPQTRNRAAESEAQRLRGPPPRRPGALRGATRPTVPQAARNRVDFVLRVIHPSVETERLLLRPWRPAEDLDALAALNADA